MGRPGRALGAPMWDLQWQHLQKPPGDLWAQAGDTWADGASPPSPPPWQQPGENAGGQSAGLPVLGHTCPPSAGMGHPRTPRGCCSRPPHPKDSLSGVEMGLLLLPGWKYQAILGDILPASVLAEIRPSPLSPSAGTAETAAVWRWGVEDGARKNLESPQQAGEGLVVGQGEWPGNRTCRGGSLGG